MSDEQPDAEPAIEERQSFLPMANQMQHPPTTDREMWIAIRSAILGIAKAIESYTDGGSLALATRAALLAIADAIERRWGLKKHKAN